MTPLRSVTVLLAATLVAVGCVATGGGAASAPGSGVDALNSAIGRGAGVHGEGAATQDYVIDPPDVIAIDVRGDDTLDAPRLVVGPGGEIHVPLVGRVPVAGLTVPQLAADLRRRYARYIRDADVSVSIVAYRSKHVYVTGEVRRPGRYAYTGSDHVLGIIAQAGFLTRRAAPDEAYVARGRPGFTERLAVRLTDIVERGDARTNWRLEPEDVIHVPPGFMARVSYAFQNVLSPFALPVNVRSGD